MYVTEVTRACLLPPAVPCHTRWKPAEDCLLLHTCRRILRDPSQIHLARHVDEMHHQLPPITSRQASPLQRLSALRVLFDGSEQCMP